jgi:hypothetical protein
MIGMSEKNEGLAFNMAVSICFISSMPSAITQSHWIFPWRNEVLSWRIECEDGEIGVFVLPPGFNPEHVFVLPSTISRAAQGSEIAITGLNGENRGNASLFFIRKEDVTSVPMLAQYLKTVDDFRERNRGDLAPLFFGK